MVSPSHRHPCLLHGDRMHPVGVMIVYHISKTVVVVYNLWVLKFGDFLDPIISPVVSSFLFSNSSSRTICCHQHHGVIGFFHCMYIKRDSIHCTFQSINMTNFFIFEVFYNFISRDVTFAALSEQLHTNPFFATQ